MLLPDLGVTRYRSVADTVTASPHRTTPTDKSRSRDLACFSYLIEPARTG